jgi:hypothetical protein
MLLEMDEENRCKIKAMINGGIIWYIKVLMKSMIEFLKMV